VAVADLPAGQDPADVAQSDPDRLVAAVDKATPFLRFRLDRVFATADLASNEGRARAAERALAAIAEHPTDLVRDQYVMDVASRCRVEPDRLRAQLERLRSRARPAGAYAGESPGSRAGRRAVPNEHPDPRRDGPDSRGGAGDASPRSSLAPLPGRNGARQAEQEGPGAEVLRHAIHDPEAVSRWLARELFDDPVQAGVHQALLGADTYAAALASAPPDVADLLARLLVEEPTSEPFDAVRRLLTEVARRRIRTLRLVGATSGDPAQALSDLAFLNRAIDDLRDPAAAADAADRLLAWIGQRVGDGG